MFRLKKWYLKQKGYFCRVGEKWDNSNLSHEIIHSYVDRVLEYETETSKYPEEKKSTLSLIHI